MTAMYPLQAVSQARGIQPKPLDGWDSDAAMTADGWCEADDCMHRAQAKSKRCPLHPYEPEETS